MREIPPLTNADMVICGGAAARCPESTLLNLPEALRERVLARNAADFWRAVHA